MFVQPTGNARTLGGLCQPTFIQEGHSTHNVNFNQSPKCPAHETCVREHIFVGGEEQHGCRLCPAIPFVWGGTILVYNLRLGRTLCMGWYSPRLYPVSGQKLCLRSSSFHRRFAKIVHTILHSPGAKEKRAYKPHHSTLSRGVMRITGTIFGPLEG